MHEKLSIPTNEPETASALSTAFPRYSQLDPTWDFEPGTERGMCGIVSLKSLLDYHLADTAPDMFELRTLAAATGALQNGGSRHPGQVDLLNLYGLLGWRRNWRAPSADTQWLVDNEGYSAQQTDAIDTQLLLESQKPSSDAAVVSIKAAVDEGYPVIASVAKGHYKNRADHQVVVVGIEPDTDAITIMDPVRSPGSPHHTESLAYFLEYFNQRAIFTKPRA